MISLSLPRSRNTCGWSNGGLAPTHMNSCEPISMTGTPASLWKCGTTLSDITFTLVAMAADANRTTQHAGSRATCWRAKSIPSVGVCSPHAHFAHGNSTQSCRPRKALLSSGRLCPKSGVLLTRAKGQVFGMKRLILALVGIVLSAAVFFALWPHARDAGLMLAVQHDPAELADIQLDSALQTNRATIEQNMDAALAAGDADLADSFATLARERHIAVPDELSRRVSVAVAAENSSRHFAERFATGLVTGSAEDVASLSGTVVGDLFVFGDIRDVLREGKHLAMGEDTDRLVLGLAAAGLAVTAATYVTIGGVAPVRAGLTMVKDARKVGRLGEGLTQWAGRSAREIVDAPVLQQAVASGSVLRPGATIGAVKAAFRAEKAGALVRLAKDVGRVGEKAGTRGALDTLRIAEGPKDVARAARLAESKGGQTRAILKVLGRGALLLAAGAFNLTMWVFGALLALFGFLSSIKATTERATEAWLRRSQARRSRKQAAACLPSGPALAGAVAQG